VSARAWRGAGWAPGSAGERRRHACAPEARVKSGGDTYTPRYTVCAYLKPCGPADLSQAGLSETEWRSLVCSRASRCVALSSIPRAADMK
jgi:hypothetical protein